MLTLSEAECDGPFASPWCGIDANQSLTWEALEISGAGILKEVQIVPELNRAQTSSWVVACASVWKSILLSKALLASGASSTFPLYFCASFPYCRDQSTETCSRHGHCTDGRSQFEPLTINDESVLTVNFWHTSGRFEVSGVSRMPRWL